MEVDCEGCAGCCIDWRPLAPDLDDHERRGPRTPLDDVYNFVPLDRDEVRGFLDAGLADALTPRLWTGDDGIEVDGISVTAIDRKPAFFVGLRKPPKPVAPFGVAPAWLPTCVFLDPTTLQCRVHDTDRYPRECADYPGHNLTLGAETECERVEATFDGARLLDDEPPDQLSDPLFGPQAVGWRVFVHPDPDRLGGIVERIAAREPTAEDRAEFVAAAAASAPGTTESNPDVFERARARALAADSWVGAAAAEWADRAGVEAPDPSSAATVEDERGAPPTRGWSV